jgi:tRNA dimethylallyltransferase
LEYRFVSHYLRGLITKERMISDLERATMDFARRQMSWFKKIPAVQWLKKPESAIPLTKRWLKKYKA